MIDPFLLPAARFGTYAGDRGLTNCRGFSFAPGRRMFLVTSRHLFIDTASEHQPDRIVLEIHSDPDDLVRSIDLSVLLFDADGVALWRQGQDDCGEVDVAAIEIDRDAVPPATLLRSFTPDHLRVDPTTVTAAQPVAIVSFHDTLHHLPVGASRWSRWPTGCVSRARASS